MAMPESFLLFCIEEGRYALNVTDVERIVRAGEVTIVPNVPDYIRGLINVAGNIIPVIDMRRRFGLPMRDMELSDRFILINMAGRLKALLVDRVEGVMKSNVIDTNPSATIIDGGIVLIQSRESLETFIFETAPIQAEDIQRERTHD